MKNRIQENGAGLLEYVLAVHAAVIDLYSSPNVIRLIKSR